MARPLLIDFLVLCTLSYPEEMAVRLFTWMILMESCSSISTYLTDLRVTPLVKLWTSNGTSPKLRRTCANTASTFRISGIGLIRWDFPASITPAEITGKTRTEIRDLARNKGLVPAGELDSAGNPRKWKDPVTGKERLRLDRGHTDPQTGLPYNDPKARVDHVHAYEPNGQTKIRDPIDNNAHFPTTGE